MNKFILEIIKQHIDKMFTLIKQEEILDILRHIWHAGQIVGERFCGWVMFIFLLFSLQSTYLSVS